MRELLNGLRYAAKVGCDGRSPPHDLPPRHAACWQARRWVAAGAFEEAAHDLRALLRLREGRSASPSAAVREGASSGAPPRAAIARAAAGLLARTAGRVHRRGEQGGSGS